MTHKQYFRAVEMDSIGSKKDPIKLPHPHPHPNPHPQAGKFYSVLCSLSEMLKLFNQTQHLTHPFHLFPSSAFTPRFFKLGGRKDEGGR